MEHDQWAREIDLAITVCDHQGIITFMNDQSQQVFASAGGDRLLGSNALECHPDRARVKLEKLLRTRQSNCYTLEKNGRCKLICQTPWFEDGCFRGLVEFSIPLPDPLPHFVRD